MPMDESAQRWVKAKWRQIRKSQQMADAANNKWHQINDEINDLLNRKEVFDVVQRNKIKSESLALKDALAAGKWHSENANRHALDLQVFLMATQMGVDLSAE